MSGGTFTTIEAFGSITLAQSGGNFLLFAPDGSSVQLSYGGAPVVAGQFGAWTPIGAEKTANGYEVAWVLSGTDQYTIWYLDDAGNFLSDPTGAVLGDSSQLESFEASFQQDLNGDGRLGLPPPTVIESFGSTTLVQSGSNYFLDAADGSPVALSYGGAPVVVGQFGAWTPIAAEKTTSGYEVVLQLTGTDQYTVWYLDISGNYVSDPIGSVSGESGELQLFETSFQQDLNGDGRIGLPPPTVIESFGSTALFQSGGHYFVGTTGPAVELSYGGSPVVVGQFGAWTPIGVEKTATGYQLALALIGADQYTIWYLDGNGNFLSDPVGSVAGNSSQLESFETGFEQDLNGDGRIGLPPPTIIEAFGSTTLVQSGSDYFLNDANGSVALSYGGAPVVVGQFGAWTPIGAEKIASGYEVALELTGADQYTVWYLDNNGNYLSSPIPNVPGESSQLEMIETSFQQDLNGDGTIGLPPPTIIEAFGLTKLVQSGSSYFLDGADSSSVQLMYNGAPVVAGQFGTWAPIGAEKTASGYEVAWKQPGTIPGSDQYTIWYTNPSGNYLSGPIANVYAPSSDLESFETSFQQDLNGDGSIGIPQITDPNDKPSFIYAGTDANGVQLYEVKWSALGSHPFAVRVLAPSAPSPNYQHSFLFALPTQPGIDESGWGTGIDELQQLNVQNQYNATIIEPVYPLSPWYADNPNDPTMDYETFTATFLPQWVDSNFASTGTETNLLVGFSKSGYGGLDLLFRHPSVFAAAAAWDFPADMPTYNALGSSPSGNYGDDANFQNNYRLSASFIDQWKAPFLSKDRIWISGYADFRSDITDFDALLTAHGVSHTLAPQTASIHAWQGNWLPEAISGLYSLAQT
jgi:hypothetical protein